MSQMNHLAVLLKILPYHTEQLQKFRKNPVKILAGGGFCRISKKGPDAGFAGAEIRYVTSYTVHSKYLKTTTFWQDA